MHTHKDPGMNAELATDLEANFVWVPPLSAQTEYSNDYLEGPESISLMSLRKKMKRLLILTS